MRWITILLGFLIFIVMGCAKDVGKEYSNDNTNQDLVKEGQLNEILIADQEQCETAGGRWQPESIANSLSFCNLPTKDAGKPCRDKKDCEGRCLADFSPEDNIKLKEIRFKYQPAQWLELEKQILAKYNYGKCDSWRQSYPKYEFINGQIQRQPVP